MQPKKSVRLLNPGPVLKLFKDLFFLSSIESCTQTRAKGMLQTQKDF